MSLAHLRAMRLAHRCKDQHYGERYRYGTWCGGLSPHGLEILRRLSSIDFVSRDVVKLPGATTPLG
jgi:hypothetical protein